MVKKFDMRIYENLKERNPNINLLNKSKFSTENKIFNGDKCKSFNFFYTNIRSLMNKYKRDEIEILIEDYNIDIIGITKSWVNEKIEDAEISFSGFTLF